MRAYYNQGPGHFPEAFSSPLNKIISVHLYFLSLFVTKNLNIDLKTVLNDYIIVHKLNDNVKG